MSGDAGDWEKVGETLGSGGQSQVFLVRNRKRQTERKKCLEDIGSALRSAAHRTPEEFANAVWTYARPDSIDELGALKRYKLRNDGGRHRSPAFRRFENEVTVLKRNTQGLPKLLDFNLDECWIVTEYFPNGTLADQIERFKGDARAALAAFRPLVATLSELHDLGFVHRDIKPSNIFLGKDGELILGDFGIVYLPENEERRPTRTEERVGPRDLLAPWVDLKHRIDEVKPSCDVYMLGKLLWMMVAGERFLPREYHRHPEYEFDLSRTFAGDVDMHMINAILDKCVVEQEADCLPSARVLLGYVDDALSIVSNGGQLLRPDVPRACHVCGKGHYQQIFKGVNEAMQPSLRFWMGNADVRSVPVTPYTCDYCGHLQLFQFLRPGVQGFN
jgi:serine/threonine protein kinase